ncbi:MAG: hypothetical protein KAU35_05480 [candidate division Zixibacteria bacterium]|nr:hypothetical protein [candidate division Zixibacteria bacterium]
MERVERFVINLNDLYGRTMSGAILLAVIAAALWQWSDYAWLQDGITDFYYRCSAVFVVTFLLVSFLVGHVTLGLSFRCLSHFRRPPSIKGVLSSGLFDPTAGKRVTEFFQSQFSESALEDRSWDVLAYCKDFLQCSYPHLHRSLLQTEARANFFAGVIFPVLMAAVVLAAKQTFLWSGLLALIGGWFIWEFVGSVGGEAGSIIRLYYIAVSSKGPVGGKSTPTTTC